MKLIPLLLCIAASVFADTVTYTANSEDFCTIGDGQSACQSSIESVYLFPQFDPTLGTLQSIGFTLTDYAQIFYGWNDLYGGVGTEYSGQFDYQLTGPDQTYTASLTSDFIASGQGHQISAGPQFDAQYTFVESGTFAIAPYDTGNSTTARVFYFTGQVYGFDFGMDGLANNGVLDVTYNYAAATVSTADALDAAVPEPVEMWVVFVALGFTVLCWWVTPKR
jgi:hypothetical protein